MCEPDLLSTDERARLTLALLDQITASLTIAPERRSEAFLALRKRLGYCWSVAMAASFEAGKTAFAKWLDATDPDVRWVLRENLKKNRLLRLDADWVAACLQHLALAEEQK